MTNTQRIRIERLQSAIAKAQAKAQVDPSRLRLGILSQLQERLTLVLGSRPVATGTVPDLERDFAN